MAQIRTLPNGSPIHIDRAIIAGVKADFVKKRVRIALDLPLDEQSLAIREQLAFLAWGADEHPVAVDLQPLQMKLIPDEQLGLTLTRIDIETGEVKSVTLGG